MRSLDLTDDKARIAGDQSLPRAVHDKVQVFQHDGPDQRALSPWLDDSREYAVPA